MPLFFEHRVVKEGKKTFDVYRLVRPRLWTGCFVAAFACIFLGVFLFSALPILLALPPIGFVMLIATVVIGGIEGNMFSGDAKIVALKGKEFRLKGSMFSAKRPRERWIER